MAKISGNISSDARLIIVKESDWSVESNTTKTGGTFKVDGLASGAKTVISRATSGESTGYGNVTAIDLVVNINLASGQTTPSEDSVLDFTVTFSDPVTDFSEANVDLSGTAGATTSDVTGSGATYNVAVSGMTSAGTVIVTINYSGATAGPSGGNEISYSPPAPSTVLHTAMVFSNPMTDGSITSSNSSWNNAREASTGTGVFTGGVTPVTVEASKTGLGGNNEYRVSRVFTEFDLSLLSATDRTVQSTTLQVGGWTYKESNICVFQGTQQSPIVAGDFDSFVNSDDPLANIITWEVYEPDNSVKLNVFTLNGGGNSYISSRMGNTAKFCFREWSSDRDSPAPTGFKRNGMYTSYGEPIYNSNTTGEYFFAGFMLKVNYMKIPVWTSIFNNTKWMPSGNNANNGVWNGSAWVPGSWGLDLKVKTGETWATGYKPNKIKITFTGPTNVDLFLYSNKARALISDRTTMSITSGQEVVISWMYPDQNITEIILDTPATVTNIEFLER